VILRLKFKLHHPKSKNQQNHGNHHDEHPLWSNGQWQKDTNGNNPHWIIMYNSVIKRIGEKK
jgi:hypothetical protein